MQPMCPALTAPLLSAIIGGIVETSRTLEEFLAAAKTEIYSRKLCLVTAANSQADAARGSISLSEGLVEAARCCLKRLAVAVRKS